MNDDDRLNLMRMVGQSECDDNTEEIRKLKHSNLIRKDLETFKELRRKSSAHSDDIYKSKCSFLYNNYTDIFNRLIKNELDLAIFERLLTSLRHIEDGSVDQHEGSVAVGTILKELYIDSALKRGNNLSETSDQPPVEYVESKNISWKQFKTLTE
jgi:hypothetical protein